MLRSLTFKLTLAFLFVSLVGAALAAFFIQQRTQTEFDRFLLDRSKDSVAAALGDYYRQTGSWTDLPTDAPWLLAGRDNRDGAPPDDNPAGDRPPRRSPYLLVNPSGVVVLGNPDLIGRQVKNFEKGVPIEVDSQVVGWLVSSRAALPWGAESPEGAFLASVNRAIALSALIALLIALVLGSLLARTLTTSLRELTRATEKVAHGELGVQVRVRSKDEVGALAGAFNQMSADLARSNQQRRQMTADIAHDLRTPLSVVLGYTEALSDGKLQGDPQMFAIMHQETLHLKHLIDDLRTLALADAGELPLQRVPMQPDALLLRTAAALRPQAEQKGIALEVLPSPPMPDVSVDPERIAQVLGNLVSNALRHTPAGGRVELSAALEPGQVCLRVRDTGSGIAPADLPHIFNRFYRGDRSRQSTGEAGLGLAIARSLVELHGGAIEAQSQPGQGSLFSVRLPADNA